MPPAQRAYMAKIAPLPAMYITAGFDHVSDVSTSATPSLQYLWLPGSQSLTRYRDCGLAEALGHPSCTDQI